MSTKNADRHTLGIIYKDVESPDIPSLTAVFFLLYFLAATQDIAVDGWSLTLLRPENVGYAATCNLVGIKVGWNFAYVVATTLEARGIMDLSQETNTELIYETFFHQHFLKTGK